MATSLQPKTALWCSEMKETMHCLSVPKIMQWNGVAWLTDVVCIIVLI